MKNLVTRYKKIELQKLEGHIDIVNDKHEIYMEKNLIGFKYEYYRFLLRDYVNQFSNYKHLANLYNYKLYRKYPMDILKKDYKKWVKDYK